jgi:hypothetical protein
LDSDNNNPALTTTTTLTTVTLLVFATFKAQVAAKPCKVTVVNNGLSAKLAQNPAKSPLSALILGSGE